MPQGGVGSHRGEPLSHGAPIWRRLEAPPLTPHGPQVEFPAEANIICEGDEGNNFYIIREGEVKCTKAGMGEVIARRLFFT